MDFRTLIFLRLGHVYLALKHGADGSVCGTESLEPGEKFY